MDSSATSRTHRKLCVNCNICVNTLRRHLVLQLDTRVISLISEWITPVIITEDNFICDPCLELARQAVNRQLHAGNTSAESSKLRNDMSAVTSRLGHTRVCHVCGRSLRSRQSHVILQQQSSRLLQTMINIVASRIAPRQISATDKLCHPCWMNIERAANRSLLVYDRRLAQENQAAALIVEAEPENPPEPLEFLDNAQANVLPVDSPQEQESNVEMEPENHPQSQVYQENTSITLPNYRRAANTASHCVFNGCEQLRDLHTVSDSLRATLLSVYNYYVPKLARVCTGHLHGNNWDVLYDSPNSMNTFTADQVEHVFSFVNTLKPFLDLNSMESIEQMDDHLFGYWFGVTKANFIALLYEIPRILEIHRGILGLGAILIKMRTGDSDARLSTLLNVPRRTLERIMGMVRETLLQYFVPRNLGFNHLTREDILSHNLMVPNGIYGNENNQKIVVICDGTYIYLNKSSNYMFQKDSYSLHKYRNLLKPFLIVACDGYILDCYGPYKATTSDAEIMSSLVRNENSSLRSYLNDNDIFILDRGFRDSISLLENCNYRAYMPDSLLEGEHQLTTEQANRSRCVTICRWVVEVVNGYFKRDFRLLRHDHFNKTVLNMMAYFQIAAALINRFGVRLRDRGDAAQILQIIHERMPLENNLSTAVTALNMNRRASNFMSITADRNNLILFPRLEYNELILFALGTYQIRQARSYYGEHIRFHGGYRIEVCHEAAFDFSQYNLRGSGDNILIRGKIKSRHVSRKQYYVYLFVENNVAGREGIVEYCCNCLVGRRTVGCCAHVMTLVWYLGWARYEQNISAPAAFLDEVVIREDEYIL